ncbi:MAG: hypothetical protein KGI25_03205 [Thaumarchaeota archaeon]|nr:hypothetical protein [Nitrososphaerota archaeon]
MSAKDGLSSELDTPQKIGLTKKQYYTRLKQLVEYGLLNKSENKYFHTAFGSIIYNKHLLGLLDSMKISKELEMIDLLKRSSKFKSDEIANFVSKLNPEINQNGRSESQPFLNTNTFDSMVRKAVEIIGFAEKEIILATRFQNELIINAILKKAERGITIKIVSDANMVEGYFQSEKDKIKVHDKNEKERINVVSNPFYPSKIERRYSKVPYCMLIVDQKQIGIEIVNNYEPNKFHKAIFGADSEFSAQIKDEFENIWKQAARNPPQIKRL